MTTLAKLKTDGNVRNAQLNENKQKSAKIGAPKIRLRLNEAFENQEKANKSDAKYSLDPSKEIIGISNIINKNQKYTNYSMYEVENRNKICQMNKIMIQEKAEPYLDENPGPRCLGNESLSYLNRNRNSSIVMGHNSNGPVQDTFYSIRCPSDEAASNLEKGRGSRMMNVLQHSTDHRDVQPSPRLRDEAAAEIYKKNQAGSMANVLNHARDIHPAMVREPRCPTSESRDTYELSLGRSISAIMGKSVSDDDVLDQYSSKKKVKDENGNEINPQNSSGMSTVMHRSRDPYSDPVCQPRVKFEGEEIAQRNRGTLTSDIYNYNKGEADSHSVPRIRPEAQEIADSCRGNATKNLMMKYGKLPGDSKPKPRTNRHSTNIAHRSQGGAMRDALCPPRQAHSKQRPRSAYK